MSLLCQGIWTVAFHTSMDALRFSHAAQMLLMYVNWPDNIKDYFGQEIPSPDGRWLFMGPRVCMAIHESPEFFVSTTSHSVNDTTCHSQACCNLHMHVQCTACVAHAYTGRWLEVAYVSACCAAASQTAGQR